MSPIVVVVAVVAVAVAVVVVVVVVVVFVDFVFVVIVVVVVVVVVDVKKKFVTTRSYMLSESVGLRTNSYVFCFSTYLLIQLLRHQPPPPHCSTTTNVNTFHPPFRHDNVAAVPRHHYAPHHLEAMAMWPDDNDDE